RDSANGDGAIRSAAGGTRGGSRGRDGVTPRTRSRAASKDPADGWTRRGRSAKLCDSREGRRGQAVEAARDWVARRDAQGEPRAVGGVASSRRTASGLVGLL